MENMLSMQQEHFLQRDEQQDIQCKNSLLDEKTHLQVIYQYQKQKHTKIPIRIQVVIIVIVLQLFIGQRHEELLRHSQIEAFHVSYTFIPTKSYIVRSTTKKSTRHHLPQRFRRQDYASIRADKLLLHPYYAKSSKYDKDDDDDIDDEEQQQQQAGMLNAFRQFDQLKSLDDPEEYIPAPDKIDINAVLANASSILNSSTTISSSIAADTTVSPEQDFIIYRNMMLEMEENEIAESYTDVLNELGNSTLQTNDTYSQIMTELGGSTKSTITSDIPNKRIPSDEIIIIPTDLNNVNSLRSKSNDQLLNDALKEAMKEVTLRRSNDNEVESTPSTASRRDGTTTTTADSILNDKEIMKEIEQIFDRGNAQLMESLEEIRREQQTLAKSDIAIGGYEKSDTDKTIRLQNAEKSMKQLLDRVDRETSNLEQAVDDLNAANQQIEQDFIWKLKQGGIPKQIALVGFILLSVRSILESITAVSLSSSTLAEAHLYAALLQGIIAMVLAAIFFLL